MRTRDSTVERQLGLIASRQHGVVTRKQLRAAGISASGIARRLEKGVLLPAHRGVYRVGHRAPSVEATYLAAVLACDEGAVLSGRAAAYLYRLIKKGPPRPEVTTPSWRRIDGVVTRRSRAIEATKFRGIPVTPVPRTLVDVARYLDFDALARVCHEAGVLYRTTPRQVEAVLARWPNAPGSANLRRILRGDARVTLSALERAFIALLVAHGLPLPQTNRVASGRRVDCRWPEQRLTVELNSYTYHDSRHAWEQDHVRAREAYARGDDFRSYTYRDVFEDPARMLAELRALLLADRAA